MIRNGYPCVSNVKLANKNGAVCGIIAAVRSVIKDEITEKSLGYIFNSKVLVTDQD